MSDVLGESRDGRWQANLWEVGRLWYEAEFDHAPPVPWTRLPQPGKESIYDRVRSVLGGTIPPAELAAGDIAALVGDWNAAHRDPMTQYVSGRFARMDQRDAEGVLAEADRTRRTARLHAMRERRLATFWDCIAWRPTAEVQRRGVARASGTTPGRTTLFGNTHVGEAQYCNLQVSGQLATDQTFIFAGWWITTTVGHDALARKLLGACIATLWMGNQPQCQQRGLELAGRKQPLLLVLPVRQIFGVILEFYGEAFKNASKEMSERVEATGEEFCIWVNVEGLQTRDVA